MLNHNPFYHAITRKAITVFGSLFKDITIERTDDKTGKTIQTLRVPITYSVKDKAIARTMQEPDIDNKTVGAVLPRLAFEIKGIQYDPSRKLNTNTINVNTKNGSYVKQYNPVPYNIQVDLYAYVKTQEDGLQIIEQILPFFTPQFTVTINTVSDMDYTYDLPIILNDVNYEDNYDGDFTERREIIWTLSFTMQVNYYGPLDKTDSGIIKRTEITFYTDKAMQDKLYQSTYEVNPMTATENDPYTITHTITGFD